MENRLFEVTVRKTVDFMKYYYVKAKTCHEAKEMALNKAIKSSFKDIEWDLERSVSSVVDSTEILGIVNSDKTHIAAVNKKNDAALIAAAPDLLRVVQDLMSDIIDLSTASGDDVSSCHYLYDAARAAIDKATKGQ